MKIATSFTNFGPYHIARLSAASEALAGQGGSLVAIETASHERQYPWQVKRQNWPFEHVVLFPERTLEDVTHPEAARAMTRALEAQQPDAVAVAGYVRPECIAALEWARAQQRPAILMSESQRVDHPRTWWKETIKWHRVRRFQAALVGGLRHRDYLVELGMPPDRIALGYNAIDHDWYATRSDRARTEVWSLSGLPTRPYFLSVSRFVPEKNLVRLVRAYAAYRRHANPDSAWDLVLCGDGPEAPAIEAEIQSAGLAGSVHRPGFLQADALVRWYAHAGAFVLASLSEPWGLVANEAAACAVPLLISERAGCVETLVPNPAGTTGWRFDPRCEQSLARILLRTAALGASNLQILGNQARLIASAWGPARFAEGLLAALARVDQPDPLAPAVALAAVSSS